MKMMSHCPPGKKAIWKTRRTTLAFLAAIICAAELAYGAPTADGGQTSSDSATTVTVWRSFGRPRDQVSPWVDRSEVFSKPLPSGCVRVFIVSFWGTLRYEDLPATTTLSFFGGNSPETLGNFIRRSARIQADYEDTTCDGGFLGLYGKGTGGVVITFCNPPPNVHILDRELNGTVDEACRILDLMDSRWERPKSP